MVLVGEACRVCGLMEGEERWGEDGKTAMFIICSCCNAESGYEDVTIKGIRTHRANWIASGHTWSDPKGRPENWDAEEQLKQIPPEYR